MLCSRLASQSLSPFILTPSADWMKLSPWDWDNDRINCNSYSPLSSPWDELTLAKLDFDQTIRELELRIAQLHKWMDSAWREFENDIRNMHAKNNNWGLSSVSTAVVNSNSQKTSNLNSFNSTSLSDIMRPEIVEITDEEESQGENQGEVENQSQIQSEVENQSQSQIQSQYQSHSQTQSQNEIQRQNQVQNLSQNQIQNRIKNLSQSVSKIQSKKYRLNIHLGDNFPPESITVKVSLKNRVMTIEAKTEQKTESIDGNIRLYREISRQFTLPPNLDLKEITSTMMPSGVLVVEAPLPQSILPEPVKITEIPIDLE